MSTVVLKSFTKCLEYPSKCFEVNIELPASLGRGPVLKCPDKKISRNHVMLDWDDIGILITSTHIRPTFVVINGEEQCLNQGQFAVLNNGDSFGLLQENFWFKVILTSSCNDDEVTKHKVIQEKSQDLSSSPVKRNEINSTDTIIKDVPSPADSKSVMKDEKNETSVEGNSSAELNKIEEIEDKVMITEDKEEIVNNVNNVSETITATSDRKRVLPDWFRAPIGKQESGAENASSKKENKNKNKKINASHVSKKVAPASKLHEYSDSDGEEVSSRKGKNKKKTKPKVQYHKISQDVDSPDFENEGSVFHTVKNNNEPNVSGNISDSEANLDKTEHTKKVNRTQNKKTKPKNKYHDLSQDVDTPNFEGENDVSKTVVKNDTKLNIHADTSDSKAKRSQIDHDISDENDDDDVDSSGLLAKSPKLPENKISKEAKKNSPRKSCQFGEECYRKNPKHREDIAHPGDSDYVSHESELDNDDDDDDRPECEYGLNCYRKNPQHKKDFKHTKKPQPARNAKKKAKRKDYSDGDSENEYDYEDPFLNDDSSDDYAPTDPSSGSDTEMEDTVEEEDTKRMIKEAKKFVKKRKH